MKEFFKKIYRSKYTRGFLLHISLIAVSIVLILALFFYVYLPSTTNFGETVTVPDLKGIHLSEIEEYTHANNLRYEVSPDSEFSAEHPPLTILSQYPQAGKKVKENRKIYITLNAQNAPKVKMPKLVDRSLDNAKMQLKSKGLKLGKITFKPSRYFNLVLEQWYDGSPVKENDYVYKGSKINLVVGDGLGKQDFPVPNVVGLEEEAAEVAILGSGLEVGSKIYQETREHPPGTVMKQIPEAKENQIIRAGEEIDIWIAVLPEGEPDTTMIFNREAPENDEK